MKRKIKTLNKRNITDKEYWKLYYQNTDIDKNRIIEICSIYNKYFKIFINNSSGNYKKIIEIGGYPGRYLAFLAAQYNLIPNSLDFNDDDMKIIDSFNLFGIKKYKIFKEDINTFNSLNKYDLVFSNGFIEHFLDFEIKLDQHASLCNKNGTIMIMIPNKKYLRKYYGYLCDNANLKKHNLKSMNLKVFREFSERNNLKILSLGYFGGFQFEVHQDLNFLQKILFKYTRIIFKYYLNPIIKRYPNKFLSSTIIGIFKK